jgi:hypothetical protein
MELRDFKDGGWGWYNHAAFELAAQFGHGTLAVYMALTKLESEKRGTKGFVASMREIGQICNMGRKSVLGKLHILQEAKLIFIEQHSAQCFMYKLLAVGVYNLHTDVQNLHTGVSNLHRMCVKNTQVYSVAKKNKSNIIPAPPGALEIIFDGNEQKDSAPAHSLAASADAEKKEAEEAQAIRARIRALEALENS